MAAPMRRFLVQTILVSPGRFAKARQQLPNKSKHWIRSISTSSPYLSSDPSSTFDERTLEYLCCPLSKKPLRYDREKNELVCDEIGVAYPIVNGIPNFIPQDARMIKDNKPLNMDSKPST